MYTVTLHGNSLALSSIAAGLANHPGLRVIPAPDLGTLKPDAIIFDLAAGPPDFASQLGQAQTRVLLIGLDVAGGKAIVFSGQSSRVLTADDLVAVIESHALKEENAPS